MTIELAPTTIDKLNRLRVLNALARTERADEDEWDELRRLTEELGAELLPLVQLIARSGLLTICAEDHDNASEKYLSPEHKLVAWDADHAFLNGNIWVEGGEVTTTMPTQVSRGEVKSADTSIN